MHGPAQEFDFPARDEKSTFRNEPISEDLLRTPAEPWNDVPVRGIVAWLFCAQLIEIIIGDARKLDFVSADDWMAIAFYASLAVWIIRKASAARLTVRTILGPIPDDPSRLPLVVAGPLFVALAGELRWLTVRIFPDFLPRDESTAWTSQLLPWGHPVRLATSLLMMLAVAPFVEEILFRSALIGRWTQVHGRRTAVVLSTTVFALLHVPIGWAFCLGLLLATIALRTGSLWMAILTHSLTNATVLFRATLIHQGSQAWRESGDIADLVGHATAALVSGGALYYLLRAKGGAASLAVERRQEVVA